jgi:hypothetical protein
MPLDLDLVHGSQLTWFQTMLQYGTAACMHSAIEMLFTYSL